MKSKGYMVIAVGSVSLATLALTAGTTFASSTSGTHSQGVPSQISALNNEIASLQATVNLQGQDIATLKQDFNNIQITQQNLQTQMSNIVSNQTQFDGSLYGIRQTLDKYGTEIASLQGSVSALSSANTGEGQQQLHTVTCFEYDVNNHLINVPLYLVDANNVTHLIDHTNPDGSVAFVNLPDGTYTLTDKDSYYPISSPQTITVSGSDVTGVKVQYGMPTYSVTVKILQNGAPYVGGNVHLDDGHGSFIAGPFTTSSDGTFTSLDVAPGTWMVEIGQTVVGNINVSSGATDFTVGQ